MQEKLQLQKECYTMQEHYLLQEVFFYFIQDIDDGTTAMDFLAQ